MEQTVDEAREALERGRPKRALRLAWAAGLRSASRNDLDGLGRVVARAEAIRERSQGRTRTEAAELAAYCTYARMNPASCSRWAALRPFGRPRRVPAGGTPCPVCGETIEPADRFCRFCGHRLGRERELGDLAGSGHLLMPVTARGRTLWTQGGVVELREHSVRLQVERRGVVVPADSLGLPGIVAVPETACGLVVFAHGSGSSRLSPRNAFVAGELNAAGLATLLLDLLTPEEERERANVFDVSLLAGRLAAATAWVEVQPDLCHLPIGYFGASTGAAAALWAVADEAAVGAVVSRGGRPDLAAARLPEVRAPTLLIVGSLDEVVLELNRAALAQLACPAELRVVEGATHLFEERGALEQVALHARDWFVGHLAGA